MEKQFDLKKFLVENKLTTNSKMLKENFDNQISVIQNFINEPLLGGYIIDVIKGPMNSIDLQIASEPDNHEGKNSADFTILGTARYYPNDEWEFRKSPQPTKSGEMPKLAPKTPADDKLLAQIALAMDMRSRKNRHNDVEDDMNEVELDEKLYGNQKRIDKNHNGRLDSQDFKMLRKDKKEDVNENVFYELTTAVNGKREKLLFNESQFEEMIENIVLKEEGKFNKGKTPAGYAEYERSIKTSKKNEEGYMKDLAKKMKDYLKDGSKGKYEMSPKHFPKGNGELEEMSKKAYVASGAIEDYIDNFTAAGLENLDYDEIHPDEDWVTDNVVGSSRTGNNPEWANAVETPNNEKRNKIRKDNMLAKLKRKAYNKAPQPVVTDKSGGGKADSIMTKLESIDEKKKQKINEDYTRIMDLMSYKKNTQ